MWPYISDSLNDKYLLGIHALRRNPQASTAANKVMSAFQPSKLVGEFISCFLVTRANFNININNIGFHLEI